MKTREQHVCACGKPATFFKRTGATMNYACMEHAKFDWKSVDAMGGAILSAHRAAARVSERIKGK